MPEKYDDFGIMEKDPDIEKANKKFLAQEKLKNQEVDLTDKLNELAKEDDKEAAA